MTIETKVLNCGGNGTLARITMPLVASGVTGGGIFVFTGEGRLPIRPFKQTIDYINLQCVKKLINDPNAMFHCLSFAIPSNRKYHMPITIYVGAQAIKELVKKINAGEYEYFRQSIQDCALVVA